MTLSQPIAPRQPAQTRDPVLFCSVCDDRFLTGALVMFASLMDRVPGFKQDTVKILFDDQISRLSPDSQTRIREVVPHVQFEPIANELYRKADIREESHRAAYLTLEVFRFAEHRRAVFVDSDMICLKDFSELFDQPDAFMACTAGPYRGEDMRVRWEPPREPSQSLPARAFRKLARKLGREPSSVEPIMINSGFMVIDQTYRGSAMHDNLNEKVRQRKDKAHMLDQIIINSYFQDRRIPLRLLPHAYNFRTWGSGHGSNEQFEQLRDEIRLVHYSGYSSRPKPWDPRASDDLGAIRAWREYARGRFGHDFLAESVAGKVTG